MNTFIFDIDGTLAISNELDERLFALAIEETIGVSGISTDWGTYSDTTDEAITHELAGLHLPQDDPAAVALRVRTRFIELVRADLGDMRRTIAPVPGVPHILARLAEQENAAVAMATGGWPESARLKLETIGVKHAEHTLCTCADHPHRHGIIEHALRRLGRGVEGAVYFGDGVWDARATRRLGMAFVGVAAEPGKRERLEAEGVAVILDDFSDADAVLHAARRALDQTRASA